MFRISKSDEGSYTTLVIDGQLYGDSVSTLESCCREEISTGKLVQLELRDLIGIDESGKVLLRRVADRGVKLCASGVYTSYLVDTIMAAKSADAGMVGAGRMRGPRIL